MNIKEMSRLSVVIWITIGVVTLLALAYELRSMALDYVFRIWNDTFGFVEDFQWFYDAVKLFWADPRQLYFSHISGTQPAYYTIALGRGVSYNYPPPSVLLYLPFIGLPLRWAYVCFLALNMICLAGAVAVFNQCVRGLGWTCDSKWMASILFLMALATGPTYTSLIFGTMNPIVLLVSIACIYAVVHDRPWWAGLFAAMGFWLKVYPAALALLFLLEARPWRYLGSFAVAIILIPFMAFPLIPAFLYPIFMTTLTGTAEQVVLHPINQSFAATLLRIGQPIEHLFSWQAVMLLPGIKMGVLLMAVILFGWVLVFYYMHRQEKLIGYVAILAILPILSPLGWGPTYELSIPLVLLFGLRAYAGSVWMAILFAAAWTAMLIPAYRPFPVYGWMGEFVARIFYERYILVILTVLFLLTSLPYRRGLRGSNTMQNG